MGYIVNEISTASTSVRTLTGEMGQITAATEEQIATMEELRAISSELSETSQQMKDKSDNFKVYFQKEPKFLAPFLYLISTENLKEKFIRNKRELLLATTCNSSDIRFPTDESLMKILYF